jgi:site-specific recombinase XerD
MGKSELESFLNYLVTKRHLAASSQSLALNSLIFMYKHVLNIDSGWLENLTRSKRKKMLPTVLSVDEVRDVFSRMNGTPKLMAALIYGTGLRVTH